MAVVVTGAAGFVGDAVVTQLLRAGERVVGVDRLPVARRNWVRSIQADLNDRDPEVLAALRRADAVIHLAGCPGVRDRRPDIAHRRRRDNVDATRAVLAGTPAVVPLVVVSSSSVYGGARFGRASREDDPLQPMGGYAESKVSAERVCNSPSTPAGRRWSRGRSRPSARDNARTWRSRAGSKRRAPAGHCACWVASIGPGTSPTSGTWLVPLLLSSGRPGSSTSVLAGRARWPRRSRRWRRPSGRSSRGRRAGGDRRGVRYLG